MKNPRIFSRNPSIAAYNAAHSRLHDFLRSPQLQDSWAEVAKATDQPAGSPRFWQFFGHVVRKMELPVGKGKNAERTNDAFKLMGSTPAALSADYALRQDRRYQAWLLAQNTPSAETAVTPAELLAPPEFDVSDVYRVTAFNAMLRRYARRHPDTSPQYLRSKLSDFAYSVALDERIRYAASKTLYRRVRGAKHELSLGQQIPFTGRTSREATPYEDATGFDHIVSGEYGPIKLDAKASLAAIRHLGEPELPYAEKDNGVIAIASGFTDNDFGDSFFVPPSLAEEQSYTLENILRRIEENRRADAVA